MAHHSVLQTAAMKGPIHSNGSGKQSAAKKKNMVFTLNLTALIDAFSILVIFLLSNLASNNTTVTENSKIQLPGIHSVEASAMGDVVRIEGNSYFFKEQPVDLNGLARALQTANQAATPDHPVEVVIQADRNQNYAMISPVLKLGAQAGMANIQFAVVQEK